MSTEFDIFPGRRELPRFEEVLALAAEHLNAWLAKIGVRTFLDVQAEIRSKSPDVVIVESASGPMSWEDDHYAWFTVADLLGGADAYFRPIEDFTIEYWSDTLLPRPELTRWREPMARAIEVGHCWNLRCSINEPAAVLLASGFVAGAIAQLTGGFVWSDDGAWEHDRLPATGAELLATYARPRSAEWRARVERWAEAMRIDFAAQG
jgi:hypothetical protein